MGVGDQRHAPAALPTGKTPPPPPAIFTRLKNQKPKLIFKMYFFKLSLTKPFR